MRQRHPSKARLATENVDPVGATGQSGTISGTLGNAPVNGTIGLDHGDHKQTIRKTRHHRLAGHPTERWT